jgi:hypothetical protein
MGSGVDERQMINDWLTADQDEIKRERVRGWRRPLVSCNSSLPDPFRPGQGR